MRTMVALLSRAAGPPVTNRDFSVASGEVLEWSREWAYWRE